MGSNPLFEEKRPVSEADGRLINWNAESKTDLDQIPSSEEEMPLQDSLPDGGFRAWVQVFGGWILVLNTRGLINTSFGAFQTFYERDYLLGTTPSAVSWIGSIQSFLLMFAGVLCGRLLDAGYLRLQISIGMLLQFVGLILASFSTQYWQLLLSQGLCVGLGAGFLYLPSVVVVSQYFSSRIMLATGIVATGSSAGGIIYPIVIRKLVSQIGFNWTMRSLALIILVLNGACLAVMRLRTIPKSTRVTFSLSTFKDLPYAIFVLAMVFLFVSVYIPYYYIPDYILDSGMDVKTSLYALGIMNAASIFGRVLPSWMADRVGGLVMMIVCSLVTCVVTFTWLGIHSTSGIITIAAMYGFASGGLVALPPATIASLSKNPDENGTRVGMAFTVCSFGTLVGNPIAGALLPSWRNGTQRFARPWLFAGGIMLIAAALMLLTYLWTRDDETDESDWPESRRTSVVYQSILDSQIATEKARLIDCDEN